MESTPEKELFIHIHSEPPQTHAGASSSEDILRGYSDIAHKSALEVNPDLGAHRLADVDDLRACLLRRRDDAGVDAAI